MSTLILSFLTSLVVTLLVVRSAASHERLSADFDITGPQKFHSRPVPRIGGIGMLAAVLASGCYLQWNSLESAPVLWLLVACGMPAFVAGLAEDLTKTMSPRRRLFATALSASLAIWLLDALIRRTDIPGVDTLIAMVPFAVALTIFAVTGVANSVNIIDGFNGLASMCVLIMLLALAYVAGQAGDVVMQTIAFAVAGAVMGFFVWNFPVGLIFMGDGGAYFLGFLLAEVSILLLNRNAGVSPMFPLLLCAYPIFETIFTMYRRKVVRGVAVGAPDGIHLHTLIHRRLIRWNNGPTPERRQTARNSMTSPYLWVLCLSSVMPAVLWWNSTPVLWAFLLLFMAGYTLLYWSIVRFKTPKWLFFRR
jgi:UDP-N-acetylmuramyl pentapeptide phosphotransferase/UDP-N-acetylglucosamine-1-phosphate transferase